MPAAVGELLVHLSARMAVGCWLGRWVIVSAARPSPARERLARWVWTLGCAIYVGHVVAAYGFVHGWSEQRAWEHTAERTAEVTGLRWGGGLYFNHLFTAVWIADVAGWWRAARRGDGRRRGFWFWAAQVYMAFLVSQATVVFGPSFWRPLAAGFAVLVAVLLGRRWMAAAERPSEE